MSSQKKHLRLFFAFKLKKNAAQAAEMICYALDIPFWKML